MFERIAQFVEALIMGCYEMAPVYITVDAKQYYKKQINLFNL